MEVLILFLSFFLLCSIPLPAALLIIGGVLGGVGCMSSWFRLLRADLRVQSKAVALVSAIAIIVGCAVASYYLAFLPVFARIAMAGGVLELYKLTIGKKKADGNQQ